MFNRVIAWQVYLSFTYLSKSSRAVCQYKSYPIANSDTTKKVSNAIESIFWSLHFTYYSTYLFNHTFLFTNYFDVVNLVMKFLFSHNTYVCLDSSVVIATRYEQDDPRFECRCGRDFPHLSRPALGPKRSPVQCVLGLFPRGKMAKVNVNHPPSSSAEV